MKRITTFAIGAALVAVCAGSQAAQQMKFKSFPARSCGTQCGTERWIIKAMADQDADKVDLTSQQVTVADLLKLVRPPSAELPIDGRFEPTEFKTYTVQATLEGFKMEGDQDFHLVIADSANSKATFIAEIPNPICSRGCQSTQLAKIKMARQKFIDKFGQPGAFKKVTAPVVITGVGYFDFRHGQTGLAPNAFEIHPVLDIQFQ